MAVPEGSAGGAGERLRLPVLEAQIDVIGMAEAVQRIGRWAARRESRSVCICNAHSVVLSVHDVRFRAAVSKADLATPDGAPVAWMLRRQGARDQARVSGPDLMLAYMAQAEQRGESIYLYGSTGDTLARLEAALRQSFPRLRIAGSHSPPFRALSREEDDAAVAHINASGAATVWVSLGCPKQELWMEAHRGRVRGVMIGVGAAFDFHAGTLRRAPPWMQQRGLEWLHRLLGEPRRLWKRYLVTNLLFVLYAARQFAFRRSRAPRT